MIIFLTRVEHDILFRVENICIIIHGIELPLLIWSLRSLKKYPSYAQIHKCRIVRVVAVNIFLIYRVNRCRTKDSQQ